MKRLYTSIMNTKIILDLCGGTGAWSRPYQEAGYDVRIITLPQYDVRTYQPPKEVYGVLAAPPCTEFARCGARWWKKKSPDLLSQALTIVLACYNIAKTASGWWALENPVGRLTQWLGPPNFKFQPWEFGDPWTKQTWLWGSFNTPQKIVGAIKPDISIPGHKNSQWRRTIQLENRLIFGLPINWIHQLGPSPNKAALRSITPPGFAQAFFAANP